MKPHPRLYARAAGILYFSTHVTSIAAVAAYGDGSGAAGVRAGVALEFALALGCLGTGLLLLPLLRPYGEVRANTFLFLRALEAAVIAAGTLPMLALVWTRAAGTPVGEALFASHTAAFLIGQGTVISVNTIILAWLLFSAHLVPRGLAILGLIGGSLVLCSNLAQLFDLIPLNGVIAALCAVPIFAFEIWWAVLLIVSGVRPRSRASATLTPTAG